MQIHLWCHHSPFSLLERSKFSHNTWILFPWWLRGKESACQCMKGRRHRFDPWVGKIPWERKWQLTPVFLPGKSHGPRSLASYGSQSCRVGHTLVTEQQQHRYFSGHPEAKSLSFVQHLLKGKIQFISVTNSLPDTVLFCHKCYFSPKSPVFLWVGKLQSQDSGQGPSISV